MELITRSSADYEKVRAATTWNSLVPDRYPAAIVTAESTEDVVAAVEYARAHGYTVKAKSGGHSWTASSLRDDNVLVDLAPMNRISYAAGADHALVGPGAHGLELNDKLAPHGMFFPTGHCSSVALGGFLLQGGFGWNSRSIGPACLSIIGVEVVTAAGELIRADRTQNTDYFWAARGAGPGYFGIVTDFEVAVHPCPASMLRSTYVFPLELHRELLSWLHAIGPSLPKELETVLLATSPRGPSGVVTEAPTALVLIGRALFASEEQGRAALELLDRSPLRDRAWHAETCIPSTFDELYRHSDEVEPEGFRWAADSIWTDAPVDQLIDPVGELMTTIPTPLSHLLWYPWRRQEFPDAALSIQGDIYLAAYAGWSDPAQDDRMTGWLTAHMARLAKHGNGTNLGDENLVRRRSRYLSPENDRKLEQMRARHDPDGIVDGFLIKAES
jgi:FAD/FMN-containing dehydrogenase